MTIPETFVLNYTSKVDLKDTKIFYEIFIRNGHHEYKLFIVTNIFVWYQTKRPVRRQHQQNNKNILAAYSFSDFSRWESR